MRAASRMLLASALGLLLLATAVRAEPPTLAGARALEQRAYALEEKDPSLAEATYLQAARAFQTLAARARAPIEAFWRSARCYWQSGDLLALDDIAGRVTRFTLADSLATRGLTADPECAECMLWKFAAMGRLRTTRGIWTGLRQVKDMGQLLDRGIELQPTHVDSERNSTLGNLYYARAVFNRVLPDWFWIRLLLGVRGDKDRALEDIHAAIALHPDRLDYQVELGSQLLCRSVTRSTQQAELAEGQRILEKALGLEPRSEDDRREQSAARVMLRTPERSCGYTGDDWLDLDEKQARGGSR